MNAGAITTGTMQAGEAGPRRPRGGAIRPFAAPDIPRVCDLFVNTFRSSKNVRRDELAAAVEATFLTSPAYRPDCGSIVHVDAEGQVDGFWGVINITLRLGERRLRAGVLCALMADKSQADPTIGLGLLRAMLTGRLDVVFSDTANQLSLDLSRPLRFTVLPMQSLEWFKILRPAGTVAYFGARRAPALGGLIRRAASGMDRLLPRLPATQVYQRSIRGSTDRPMDQAAFIAAAPDLVAGYALRPAWDEVELAWALGLATQQVKNGPLHIREVLDRSGERAGAYLLYARAGGVAHALQVLARPGREEVVTGNLLRHATDLGAVAVRGMASREALLGLLRQPGILYRHVMNTIVWAKDKEVTAAVEAGDIMLGGLAGETFTRIFADNFT